MHATILALLVLLPAMSNAAPSRLTISLNGDWRVGESVQPETMPTVFDRIAPVPGLSNLAVPAFPHVDQFESRESIDMAFRLKKAPESTLIRHAGISRQPRNYFWYRRSFRLAERRAVALLRVNKAQFGTAVWINGKPAGEHLGCFSAGIFDITPHLNWNGDNDLVIRIGAHPAVLPVWAPAGTDFEKNKWTPGIYDDVKLILTSAVAIETVQVAPRLASNEAEIETVVVNRGASPASIQLRHAIRPWKGGPSAGSTVQVANIAAGGKQTIRSRVKIPSPHLWSPEDPFLYVVESSTGQDSLITRFGMREFRFDTATKRAYLNGKLYFLRGSNITLHRFFEDPLCKRLPWDEAWVRKLLAEWPKKFHWNSFRFCIGPAPDLWFDIADEAGLLIQNEFFMWNDSVRLPPYQAGELITQYSEWMRDHWNHPSVAIWDACNETDLPLLREEIIPAVRKLDLSERPWDTGYSIPSDVNDPVEDHPYLFSRLRRPPQSFAMTELEQMTGAKTNDGGHPSAHATIANEYGYLWLTREGQPTVLTEPVYERILGSGATPAQRFDYYAYTLAGLTEFWRAHRNYAGVQHFCFLTASYPGVKTGDHWTNLERLELEPHFLEWMSEAFKPLGVYINFWQPEIPSGAERTYSVMMVNDYPEEKRGRLRLAYENGGSAEVEYALPAWGAHTWNLTVKAPGMSGPTVLTATASSSGLEPTRSRRRLNVR